MQNVFDEIRNDITGNKRKSWSIAGIFNDVCVRWACVTCSGGARAALAAARASVSDRISGES